VKFALVFAARLAMLQVNGATVVHIHVPGPLSETNDVLAGKDSVNTTEAAAAGPPFVTVCENVILLPAVTGFGLPELVTLRSACPAPATAMLNVAVLSVRFVS
jgi:hypothetical protein